jgi:hypothetical protein
MLIKYFCKTLRNKKLFLNTCFLLTTLCVGSNIKSAPYFRKRYLCNAMGRSACWSEVLYSQVQFLKALSSCHVLHYFCFGISFFFLHILTALFVTRMWMEILVEVSSFFTAALQMCGNSSFRPAQS